MSEPRDTRRFLYAKVIGLILVVVGGLGGGFLLPAAVLFVQGGASGVHEAVVRTAAPSDPAQRMLEVAAFCVGAALGIWLLLGIFLHLGIARGFFTKAEAIALLRGSRRPGITGTNRREER